MDSGQRLTQANYFNEAGMIDGVGNQASYRYVIYNSDGSINYRGNYSTTYLAYDSYKEGKTTATWSKAGSAGTTTNTYTDRGELIRVDVTGAQTYTRMFASNREGQLTTVRESSGVQSHAYFQGREIANFGNANATEITDTVAMVTQSAYGLTPGSYVVSAGDTLQSIAQQMWGDDAMWYLIADANGLSAGSALTVGDTLKIPNVLGATHNDSNDFKPYNPDDVIGDTTPSPKPKPPKKKKKKSGGLASVVMVVVAVVAAVVTAGAAATVIASGWSALGAAGGLTGLAATGAGVLTGTAGLSLGATLGGAFIGGAVGSAASQVVGKAMGVVDDFSWRQVAAGGLTASLTAGTGVLASTAQASSWASTAAQAIKAQNTLGYSALGVFNYASSQVVNRVVGLDTTFSWSGVAASIVGANIAGQVGNNLNVRGVTGSMLKGQIAAHATAATKDKWFGGGRPDYGQVAADAFGNTLANFAVDRMQKTDTSEVNQNRLATAGDPFGEEAYARYYGMEPGQRSDAALPYDIWRKGQIDNFTRSDFDLRYTGEEAPPLIITHASNSTNYSGIEFPASGWSAALEVSELVRYRASAWEAGLCTPSTGSFTAGSGTPFLDTVNLALPGSKSLLVGLGNSIAVVTGLGKTEKINWFDGHILSKAEEFDAKFLNVTAVGSALIESVAASAGKLLLKGVSDNSLIKGAAFRHQTKWAPNVTGPRSVDDALRLADDYGVYIADDVNIRFVDDVFYDRQFGKYGDSYASYGHVEVGNPNQQLIWRGTLADKDGNVNIYVRKSVLESDESIVAVLHHETHEVEALRDIFAKRVSLPAREYSRLINDSTPGNLHWEAVDVGDQAVWQLRQDRGL